MWNVGVEPMTTWSPLGNLTNWATSIWGKFLSLSFSLFWWKHTIILINMCEKHYLQWVWQWSMDTHKLHYMGSGTCWIANKQDKGSIEERISTCSNKENCHISTPFNFRRYAFTPCLPSNTKALCMSPIMTHPQYLKNRKTISISEFGSTCVESRLCHPLSLTLSLFS